MPDDSRVIGRQCRHLANALEVRQRTCRVKVELVAVEGLDAINRKRICNFPVAI